MVTKKATTTNNATKKTLVLVGSLVALALIAGPIISASTWKSSTRDDTNKTIEKINRTNRDISMYTTKLQSTDDDYAKLLDAYNKQQSTVKSAQSSLKGVGGISAIDVTGAYGKASKAHDELKATYIELVDLNNAGIARATAEREVAKNIATIDGLSEENIDQMITSLKEATSKVKTFADGSYGTSYDKEFAAAMNNFVIGLEALKAAESTGDMAAASAAGEQLDGAMTKLAELQARGEDEAKAFQKKFDANVERLNKAVKELE